MENNNKKLGNNAELALCAKLSANGWWVHRIAYDNGGQPFDIVASKDEKAMFVDVKHCVTKRFPMQSIRPNQLTAMELLKSCGTQDLVGFMVVHSGTFFFLKYSVVTEYFRKGAKSIPLEEMTNADKVF